MNNAKHDPKVPEQCLRGYRVVAPTPELKARVLGAAREAWIAAPSDDVLWIGPVLRFAACLVLAILPVVWAHVTPSPRPDHAIVKVQESPAARQTADLWAEAWWPELARLHLQGAKPETPPAELLARHLQALAAEAGNLRANGG
jgi:hypothetical protein